MAEFQFDPVDGKQHFDPGDSDSIYRYLSNLPKKSEGARDELARANLYAFHRMLDVYREKNGVD